MSNISQFLRDGQHLDYTPAAASYAGNVVNLGRVAGFLPRDIGASALGTAMVSGVIKVPATATLGNIGDNVWWDANGTPVGGTTDGACSTNAYACQASADFWLGTLVKALAVGDGQAHVAINKANPNLPAWTDKAHFLTAVDASLVAATHSGGVMHVTADVGFDTVILTPAGVVGMDFIIQNDDADGVLELTVGPNGTEIYAGMNLTNANGEDSYLTQDTSIRGDYLHLVCDVATTSWRCVGKRGIWLPA